MFSMKPPILTYSGVDGGTVEERPPEVPDLIVRPVGLGKGRLQLVLIPTSTWEFGKEIRSVGCLIFDNFDNFLSYYSYVHRCSI